jgi:hypothetical protein
MDLFDFWARLGPAAKIHPDDEPYFSGVAATGNRFQTASRPPAPWDGPLRSAKVVVCYANPGYSAADNAPADCIRQQLSGRELLPDFGPEWDQWYRSRLASIGLPLEDLRPILSIFNLCPYWSSEMGAEEARLSAGLPSVWAAQKHLRETLIPAARRGELFLVVARAHAAWGVVEGGRCATYRLVRNRAGSIKEIGPEIGAWLLAGNRSK